MASTKTRMALAFLLTMVALFGLSLGAVHKVGDSSGWTIGDIDYANWASARTFHVGDSLVFEYNGAFHDVVEVSHDDFQSCKGTSAIATYTSGSDSVTLQRPGHYYFLCGVPGHCQVGQKLHILVQPASSIAPTASPTPTPSVLASSPPANPPSETSPAAQGSPAQSGALSLISFTSNLSLVLSLVAIYVFGVAF
ncbi:Plastocyanin-like protein [Corchorus capsularis]|uniref:Plastocyanin-like protein n=1 Tax=Corchorus capsularis TaxID=210143 RepID=A0A1R3HP29_COCAP|nr:Plastocyanin-like protein [Corchorus capsularis]